MPPALLLFAPATLLGAVAAWWIGRAYASAGGGVRPALIGAGIGLLAAIALYSAIGRPDMPDEPYGPRIAALMNKNPAEMTADEVIAVLEARAKADPADPRPLIFAGEILTQLGRPDLALAQFQAALLREPKSVPALVGLGRAQFALGQGEISDEALATFRRIEELAPEDPIPWLYRALAASQTEAYADAAVLWPEVLKRLPPDDPRRAMALQMIAEARAKTAQRR